MFTFIDLFAGIGGFHYGLKSVGGCCVLASESDKFARQTYRANHEVPLLNYDIRLLDERCVPDHDVLCAGFPCQPFSRAGKELGFEDIRGSLFFEIARVVKHKKSKVVILENVKGLVSHDKGKTLAVMQNILSTLGYKITYGILDSRFFGVPQRRDRFYLVATLGEQPAFSFSPLLFRMPPPSKVADVLDDDVDQKYTISDKLWDFLKAHRKKQEAKGNGFGYSIAHPSDKSTRTITARYYKDGSEALLFQEWDNPRRFTPREIARLQGFPEAPEFVIPVSDTQAYKQLGNAVTVPVVQEIGTELIKQGFVQ